MNWEYAVLGHDVGESTRSLEKLLSNQGADGWELASTAMTSPTWMLLIFKRPKR